MLCNALRQTVFKNSLYCTNHLAFLFPLPQIMFPLISSTHSLAHSQGANKTSGNSLQPESSLRVLSDQSSPMLLFQLVNFVSMSASICIYIYIYVLYWNSSGEAVAAHSCFLTSPRAATVVEDLPLHDSDTGVILIHSQPVYHAFWHQFR